MPSPIPVGRFLLPLDVNQRAFPQNRFNRCLSEERKVWEWIAGHGGLKNFCAGMKYHDPPWIKMPAQGQRFQQTSSIPLPAANGIDTLVLSFLVPNGYDGVGLTLIQNYTGANFNEGSGYLTWRIQLNQRYPKNLGSMQTSMGSFLTPYPINAGQLLLQSDQLVQYFVNRSTTAAGLLGGRIICSIWGYWYPRGTHVP